MQGATSHGADPVVRAMQKHESSRIKDIQKMMIDIAKTRYSQITRWGAEGLEQKLQEAAERGRWRAREEGEVEDDSAIIHIDDDEAWHWQERQPPEGLWQDEAEDEWDWAVPIDMDGNELFAVPKSPGPGVRAEPGKAPGGKSAHSESGDEASRDLNGEDDKLNTDQERIADDQGSKDRGRIEGEEDDPGYDWKGPQGKTKGWFTGKKRPRELQAKDWKYEHAVYPALIWYWQKIQWEEQEGDISWSELAIDFQAATHVGLTRKDEDWEEETLAWRARIMASATRSIEELCQETVNPGRRNKAKGLVRSIRPLGFTWQRGIRKRPKLLRKEVVNQVLLEEAIRAATDGTEPNTKHIPDIRS